MKDIAHASLLYLGVGRWLIRRGVASSASAVYLASRVCSGVNSSAEEPVLATVLPVYCTPATEKR